MSKRAWTTFECEECGQVEEFDVLESHLTEECPSCGGQMTSEMFYQTIAPDL